MTLDHARQQDLLRRVAAHKLAGSSVGPPGGPFEDVEFRALLAQTHQHRLAGHLVEAIDDGALLTTDAQADAAAIQHAEFMSGCLVLEQLLLEVVELLDSGAIEHRVLKGPAVAHLDYRDASQRCFGDIDLLVPADRIEDATRRLESQHFVRRYPEPRPGFDRRFTKGAAFRTPDGLELDVHRTLALGRFGLTVDLADLWAAAEEFHLAGRPVAGLGRTQRSMHACYHSALGDHPPRFVALRDVAQLLAQASTPEVEAVQAMAARWRASSVVARGVRLAWEAFELEPTMLSEWAFEHRSSGSDRRALATYLDPTGRAGARALVATGGIRGVRAKCSYLFALAFPTSGAAASSSTARRQRWAKGAKALVKLIRGKARSQ